jgi:hypothetical protein
MNLLLNYFIFNIYGKEKRYYYWNYIGFNTNT